MRVRRSGVWVILLLLAGATVVLGITQVLTGLTWQAIDVTGRTIDQLRAESPAAMRLGDYALRLDGVHLVVLGVVLAAVILRPYRQGHDWAWWVAWALPGSVFGFVGASLAYGAVGPAVSATVVGVLASIALAVDRGRAAASQDAEPGRRGR